MILINYFSGPRKLIKNISNIYKMVWSVSPIKTIYYHISIFKLIFDRYIGQNLVSLMNLCLKYLDFQLSRSDCPKYFHKKICLVYVRGTVTNRILQNRPKFVYLGFYSGNYSRVNVIIQLNYSARK